VNKENMKKEILEQQKEVVSENFVGIDYDAVFPRTTAKSLMVENEKLCYFGDFGVYVKGEW
jgi:hypothetical protein